MKELVLPEEDIDDDDEEEGDEDGAGPFPAETNVWIGPFVWISVCSSWLSTGRKRYDFWKNKKLFNLHQFH